MANSDTTQTPLDAATGAAGAHVVNALKLLSDETRLTILLALWDGYEPYGPNEAMSFSELHDRVAVRDTANFTYHLDKLTEHFVEKTDNGYRLRKGGLILVRTVIAGTGLDEITTAPTELDISCTRCGDARLEISYRDGSIYLTCPECDGFTTTEEHPRGTIAVFEFNPAGIADRSPSELLAASAIRSRNHFRMMKEGVCPACSGPINASLRLCEDHTSETGNVCPECGQLDSARVRCLCTVCKRKSSRPVEFTVVDHPAVISFYADHGIDIRWNTEDIEGFVQRAELLWAIEHTIVSIDPVRIRVTIPCDGEELHVLLDESWDVIDISGPH